MSGVEVKVLVAPALRECGVCRLSRELYETFQNDRDRDQSRPSPERTANRTRTDDDKKRMMTTRERREKERATTYRAVDTYERGSQYRREGIKFFTKKRWRIIE